MYKPDLHLIPCTLDIFSYFLGHCIGRTNQRFFIVFCFYAAVGSILGVINLLDVMSYYRNFWTLEIFYYLVSILWISFPSENFFWISFLNPRIMVKNSSKNF
jgi:hypothetical protein